MQPYPGAQRQRAFSSRPHGGEENAGDPLRDLSRREWREKLESDKEGEMARGRSQPGPSSSRPDTHYRPGYLSLPVNNGSLAECVKLMQGGNRDG
ncbi:hypothetical protein BN2475_990011 [Paraburkholderia ribeironis]|uniref:Uncharacterized protein n=1 Tax=Paraburkholderia ribeironis TaxID=1247936 RepID=A0A1N7SLU5_9BURK|nr:hypothetical protein BN2475_990011 [Paraburkholderia ribeironis]